jgi:hypothetical protein
MVERMMDYPGTPGQRTRTDTSYVGHHEMEAREDACTSLLQDFGQIADEGPVNASV